LYTLNISHIDDYRIITNIKVTPPDPVKTQKRVDAIIESSPEILKRKTRAELLNENVVPSRPGPGQVNIDDTEGKELYKLFSKLGPHEKLQLSGDKIEDRRDTEYWIKQSDIWSKNKIERFGETLPHGAILLDELSQTQQKEIAEQTEAERIANLSPEQKNHEKEAAIAAVKREVRCLKDEADIADEAFNAKAEYQSRKAAIENKYS